MDSASWLLLVILTLTRLLHKEVLSGDYINDINIKSNEQRIKYGGTEVKKRSLYGKEERKERSKERKTCKGKQEGGECAGIYTVIQVPVLVQTADTKISVRIFPGLKLTCTGTNTRGYLHWQSASACSYQLLTV